MQEKLRKAIAMANQAVICHKCGRKSKPKKRNELLSETYITCISCGDELEDLLQEFVKRWENPEYYDFENETDEDTEL
jgi:uncharacterized protein with PIN domain